MSGNSASSVSFQLVCRYRSTRATRFYLMRLCFRIRSGKKRLCSVDLEIGAGSGFGFAPLNCADSLRSIIASRSNRPPPNPVGFVWCAALSVFFWRFRFWRFLCLLWLAFVVRVLCRRRFRRLLRRAFRRLSRLVAALRLSFFLAFRRAFRLCRFCPLGLVLGLRLVLAFGLPVFVLFLLRPLPCLSKPFLFLHLHEFSYLFSLKH